MLSGMAAGVIEPRSPASLGVGFILTYYACFDTCLAKEVTAPLEQQCEIKAFASKSNCAAMREFNLYHSGSNEILM